MTKQPDKRQLLPFDPSKYQKARLGGMTYWVTHCKDQGLVCGVYPTGNCRSCYAGMVPPPVEAIREEEMRDQPNLPDDETALVVNLHNHRWFKDIDPMKGITHRGWWRRRNGQYVPSWVNTIRSDERWIDDVNFLLENKLRMCDYDPDRTIDPASPEIMDRGPGLYITPVSGDGTSENVTSAESIEVMQEIVKEKTVEGVELSPYVYVCLYCRHKAKMEKREDGLHCIKCGTKKVRRPYVSAGSSKRANTRPIIAKAGA